MRKTDEIYDITIIGAGPVGLFTAFYAGMREAKTKIIDSLEIVGGQPAHIYPEKFIYDLPAHPQLSGAQLAEQLVQQLSRFDTNFALGQEAINFELIQMENDSYYHLQTDKESHYTRTLIIATGNGAFAPRKLSLKNTESYEGNSLHYYIKNKNDFAGKQVAVLGGGDSAVDTALMLEDVADQVFLIHRRDKFRAHESSVTQLKQSNVQVYTPYIIDEIIGDGHQIDQIRLNKTKSDEQIELDLDDLVVSYGFVSSLGEIRNWGLDLDRTSILVNDQLETNIPGVYAVGDVASYPGKVKIIATGFGEAPQAVQNALNFINPDYHAPTGHSSDLF